MEEKREREDASVTRSDEELYIRPKIAYKKMKVAQTLSQTVYIYGISGTGKTAFIRSCLGKRNYYYYSAENLTEEELDIPRCGKKIIVVLDDLHLLRTDMLQEGLQKRIRILVERPDIWLILSGRSRMPSWLTPLYYRHIFTVIEENDLKLLGTELADYLGQWGLSITEDEFHKIEQLTTGIGIVARIIATELSTGRIFDETCIDWMRNSFWDYLDHHVYEQWDVELQEFMMQISIVDQFDCRLAEMITGRTDVERMVDLALQVGNFLSVKESVSGKMIYEIRFPMGESMRRRLMRTYPKETWESLYYNAGLYYELEDDTPNALKMYEICHDMERIAKLLVSNARKNPASGHYFELRKYYLALPEERIREYTELMAGMSMLWSMLLNIEESERWYHELENAEKNMHASAKKAAKSWLVYLDIALPHRGSLKMTDIMKNASSLMLNRKITLHEFSVTSNLPSMMNGGKDFSEWSRKDVEIARTLGKVIEFTLGRYGKGMVNLALAESFLEKGGNSYEISNLANKGIMQAQSGGKFEQCFVGTAILAWLHVLNSHAEDAEDLLASFYQKALEEKAFRLLPNLTALQIWIGLYRGKTAEALQWQEEQAPNENQEFACLERFRYLIKVRIYLMAGKNEKAVNLIQRLRYYADLMRRTIINIEAKLLLAIAAYRMGEPQWDTVLMEVLTEAESYHYVRIISREGAAVIRLLRETAWEPKNQDYWQSVLKETEQMALSYPGYLKSTTVEATFSENAIKILKLQAEGLSSIEIANMLGLKIENVKYHNKQNFKKLGVNSKTAAVTEARKRKLI